MRQIDRFDWFLHGFGLLIAGVLPLSAQVGTTLATLRGSVTDATNGKTISGARVLWASGGGQMAGTTGLRGAYALALPVPGTSPLLTVSIRANLYQPATETVTLHSGLTSTLNFRLVPIPASEIGSAQGRVTDASTGRPMPGVKITIRNSGPNLATKTAADGSYQFAALGPGLGLILRAETPSPPCLVLTERPFSLPVGVANPVVVEDFSLAEANSHASPSTCPTGPLQPAANPAGDLPDDRTFQWKQADASAIQTDAQHDSWNAGHVNDLLTVNQAGGLLAASDTGGVWLATPGSQDLPLSDTWSSV